MAVGTQLTGYAGPDLGPFKCGNCAHFEKPGFCKLVKVIADPEVRKSGGMAVVKKNGCCNEFDPRKK